MTSPPSPASSRFTERFRLFACSLVLMAVAFSQRPGQLVGDTKLDLVVDPAGMLARSLHLWDPQGGFGQVQNQAYGYLFPMGPFFWLGDALTMPGWVVQRMWWSLLLVVAFLGAVKLCSAMRLGTPTSRIVAGFAYALSPRILTLLGPISVEAWPSALAPWVLVPLVLGARAGSARRAALMSALAVAATGGVNAAATFAVIPLGVLWLLTREPGPRRRSLMSWWPLFVLLGTAWWLVPLLLLGRYSPPFLDYIETASVTTVPTTLFDALRGTSHWVPYVDPTWQAGNDLVSTSHLALNSGVLLLFGIVGMTIRRNPHRQFLVLATFLGLLMVTAGHGGALEGWFGGLERQALDGVLAPLRNVHKFDLVIRLPLVLGLAHLLAVMGDRAADTAQGADVRRPRAYNVTGDRVAHLGVLMLCVISVAGAASPALTGRLGPANDFQAVPSYWSRTADWLDRNSHDTTALLVPGSSFGFYVWGDPDDEPLQPLVSSAWAVRNAVPLAPAGNIRMLDAIESQLASGRPSAGLAGYLRRAGIGHLVVRNDLRSDGQPEPVLVHQVLDGSPGVRRVARFGPQMGSPARIGASRRSTVVDDGWVNRYPAVEIYEVSGAQRAVVASGSRLVVGGPEDLLDLNEMDLLGDEPAILAADAPYDVDSSSLVLTDGLRRREANFARIEDGKSATLAAGDRGRRGAPARDYTMGSSRWETHEQILGARRLEASSSSAFADTQGPVAPETLPFSAFDGLLGTAWKSGPTRGDRPWIGIEFDTPRSVPSLSVVVANEGSDKEVERLRVRTVSGTSRTQVARPGQPVSIRLPPGRTSGLRVERAGTSDRELALAEVQIPGVDVDRTLVLPRVPARWGPPDSILLSSTEGWRESCVKVDDDVRCGAGRGSAGEEPGALDRTIRLGAGAAYDVSASVTPMDGEALQRLIQRDQLVNVRASSTAVKDDARGSAVAAIDGDPGTTWVADHKDKRPALSINWLAERTVRSVRVTLDRQAAGAHARRIVLEYPGGRQSIELDSTGTAHVDPFRTKQMEIRFVDIRPTTNRLADGTQETLGVGVSELRLSGTGLFPIELSELPVNIGCSFGPTLRVGIGLYPTSVTASPQELFSGGMLPATVCGPPRMELPAQPTRVVLAPAPAFRGLRVVMKNRDAPQPVITPAAMTDESPVERVLMVPSESDPVIAAVRENQNEGWVASVPGAGSASRVTVDGWQQGWRLKGPVERVELSYAPDRLYRSALALGGFLLVLLAAAAVVRRRRRASTDEPLGSRLVPPLPMVAAGLLGLGLMAGWWALLCGMAALVVAAVARRWVDPDVVSWASGLLLAVASLFYWLRPLGSADGWAGTLSTPQLLVAAALGVLLSVDLTRDDLPRFLRSIAGRSTSR